MDKQTIENAIRLLVDYCDNFSDCHLCPLDKICFAEIVELRNCIKRIDAPRKIKQSKE